MRVRLKSVDAHCRTHPYRADRGAIRGPTVSPSIYWPYGFKWPYLWEFVRIFFLAFDVELPEPGYVTRIVPPKTPGPRFPDVRALGAEYAETAQGGTYYSLDVDDVALAVLLQIRRGTGEISQRLIDGELNVHDVHGSFGANVAGKRGGQRRAAAVKLVSANINGPYGIADLAARGMKVLI